MSTQNGNRARNLVRCVAVEMNTGGAVGTDVDVPWSDDPSRSGAAVHARGEFKTLRVASSGCHQEGHPAVKISYKMKETLHIVDVRLTRLINITYLLTQRYNRLTQVYLENGR